MSYDRQRAETVEDPDHVRMSRDAGMCGTRGSTRSVKAVHNSVIYARFFLHLSCMPMGGAECKAQCEGRGVYFQLSSYMKRTIDSETNRYLRRLLFFRSNSILATRPRVLFKQLVKQRIVTDVLSIFDRTVEHVQN